MELLRVLLGGSWVAISRVISALKLGYSYRPFITTTHEPPNSTFTEKNQKKAE